MTAKARSLNMHVCISHPLDPQLTTLHDSLGGFFGFAFECRIRVDLKAYILLRQHTHRTLGLLANVCHLVSQHVLALR